MASQSPMHPNQTFAYIQCMLTELRILSESEDAPMLAYLIEMAIIEANDLADSINVRRDAPQGKTQLEQSLIESLG